MPIKYLYNRNGLRLTSSQKRMALFFLIAVAVGYFVGDSIANDHSRRLNNGMGLFIGLLFMIWILNKNSQRPLFTVFMVAIAFSSVTYRISLPSGINLTLSEVVFLMIFCLHLLLRYNNRLLFYYTKKEIVLIGFFLIYILGGFLNILFTHVGLGVWIDVCVFPLIIVYLSFSLISSPKQVRIAIVLGFLSLIVCLIFATIALKLGSGGQIENQVSGGQLSAEGSVGRIKFIFWATHVGAAAAMALPLVIVFSLYSESIKQRLLFTLGSMIALYIGYRAATRGFAIATAASVSIIIMLLFLRMRRKRLRLMNGIIKYVFILCMFFVIFQPSVSTNVQDKFYELYNAGLSDRTFVTRINLISDAYGSLLDNPIGVGYNTLFRLYGTDEANFYSWSANGVGLIGVIGFWGIIAILLIQFIKAVFNRNIEVEIFSIIGIGTMISTLISALSSQTILFHPHSAFAFWVVMGAVFKSTYLDNNKSNAIA